MLNESASREILMRRGLELIRLANGEGRSVGAEIRRMRKELRGILLGAGSAGRRDLLGMLRDLSAVVSASYDTISKQQRAGLDYILQREADYVRRALGFERNVSAAALTRALDGTTVFGQTVPELWARQGQNLAERLSVEARTASATNMLDNVLEARTTGADGPFPAALRNAQAAVESTILSVAQAARLALFEANGIKELRWDAVLDSTLCPNCGARHSKLWGMDLQPIGHTLPLVRVPPFHPHCRCFFGPLSDKPEDRDLDPESFEDFIRRADPADVAEVLGKGRAEMYLAGKITLRDLVGQGGRVLNLRDLR